MNHDFTPHFRVPWWFISPFNGGDNTVIGGLFNNPRCQPAFRILLVR